ncbi:MAG TPA: hypothetical protein ENI61_00940 [Ignavibacteria bacterium]|nr:hypothetical protein [Ignavibacteria bacterium]
MSKNEMIKTPVDEANFCIIDVETTGLSSRTNNIIEIGLVKVSGLKIIDTFHSLINPGRDIPYYTTQLTGINNQDIYEAPFFEDIVDEIEEFIGEDILTAHNFPFDFGFLKKEFKYCGKNKPDNPNLCTLKLARRLYPQLKSKSLHSLSKYLRLINKNEHRALGDAEITAHVLIKMIKEVNKKHGINNIDELLRLQSLPKTQLKKIKIKKELANDIAELPVAPGIYYFLNSKNEIIYIGKTKSLRDRVNSYFSQTAPKKAKKIIQQASRLKIKITNSELSALLTEAESIKLVNPKHNSQLKKYGNKYFLKINCNHKFPTLEITNHFDFDGNDYFGLFISKKKADSVFKIINKAFALRECNDKEFAKGKKCFLADIERCTAPCVNNRNSSYLDELEKVYEFLYGKNQIVLNRLIHKMKEHSQKRKYEKAAEVKSLIELILSQIHKSSLLAEPVNLANVLFEINEGWDNDYVLMLEGKIYIKKYELSEKDYFEDTLNDYFEGTVNVNKNPTEEDLEKMKITLNWLIKNRNKARTFYLKDFTSKQDFFNRISLNNYRGNIPQESTFNLHSFLNEDFYHSK